MIPVYIVTGFISSGKSTFINEQLQYRKNPDGYFLIVDDYEQYAEKYHNEN